jgi:hypothetical protein
MLAVDPGREAAPVERWIRFLKDLKREKKDGDSITISLFAPRIILSLS